MPRSCCQAGLLEALCKGGGGGGGGESGTNTKNDLFPGAHGTFETILSISVLFQSFFSQFPEEHQHGRIFLEI